MRKRETIARMKNRKWKCCLCKMNGYSFQQRKYVYSQNANAKLKWKMLNIKIWRDVVWVRGVFYYIRARVHMHTYSAAILSTFTMYYVAVAADNEWLNIHRAHARIEAQQYMLIATLWHCCWYGGGGSVGDGNNSDSKIRACDSL